MLIIMSHSYNFIHITLYINVNIMDKTITGLGRREAEFLSSISKGGGQFVHEDAVRFWGSAAQASGRLRKKNWVARVERGKYVVIPLEAGVEREWSGDPYLVASSLVEHAAIAYSTAMRHWNWSGASEGPVYIQMTGRKNAKGKTVLGVEYRFVRVHPAKFFGHVPVLRTGTPVLVTDREKTLVDAGDDVDRAGGIDAFIRAVRSAALEISWATLGDYGMRFPNRSALKRLGFIIESELPEIPGEGRDVLEVWRSHLSAGVVPLQPGTAEFGRISTRWRVRVNVERPGANLTRRGN